jgi:flagellar basal-body rod protein FlgC
MGMFSSFDISTSALVAQRARLNAISSNIANMSTTRNELGEPEPYQPRYVTFESDAGINAPGGGRGVKVASVEHSTSPPRMKYEPGHPDADELGYVRYPAIDMTMEFVDALEATRAYEANVGVIEVTKNLAEQTLRIIA